MTITIPRPRIRPTGYGGKYQCVSFYVTAWGNECKHIGCGYTPEQAYEKWFNAWRTQRPWTPLETEVGMSLAPDRWRKPRTRLVKTPWSRTRAEREKLVQFIDEAFSAGSHASDAS